MPSEFYTNKPIECIGLSIRKTLKVFGEIDWD